MRLGAGPAGDRQSVMPRSDSLPVPLSCHQQAARFWHRPLIIWVLALIAAVLSTHHLWLVNDHGLSDDDYITSIFVNMSGWLVAVNALVLGSIWLAVGPRTLGLAYSVVGLLILAVFGVLWLSVS